MSGEVVKQEHWIARNLLWLGPSIVLVLWLSNLFAPQYFYGLISEPGEFGDQFGAVNSLFAGLAFAGLIYAILLQRQELKLQREELEQTREELKGQKEQLEAQNRSFQQQNFERSFFEIYNQLIARERETVLYGTPAKEAFNVFKDTFRDPYLRDRNLSNGDFTEYLSLYFRQLSPEESDLSKSFVTTLFCLIRYVHRSNVNNKDIYYDIVRALLSQSQLFFVFYYCIGHEQFGEHKAMAQRTGLFRELKDETLLRLEHREFYSMVKGVE